MAASQNRIEETKKYSVIHRAEQSLRGYRPVASVRKRGGLEFFCWDITHTGAIVLEKNGLKYTVF